MYEVSFECETYASVSLEINIIFIMLLLRRATLLVEYLIWILTVLSL